MSDNHISVLILGGTGAIGAALAEKLAMNGCAVTVTSRSNHRNQDGIVYLKGNAREDCFLQSVLCRKWDCIVDFMIYRTEEFKRRVKALLSATAQYLFISSARVYAQSDYPITEDMPRLLDICSDRKYLMTEEYALAKARQENILIEEGKEGNYTIVRPSLTYNSNRLQFALGEKEEWLYRTLYSRSILFPKDMRNVRTTMAWGDDVATAIAALIGNPKAISESVHITGLYTNTWQEILDIYQEVLDVRLGYHVKVIEVENSLEAADKLGRFYQIKYARGINREFNCSKLWELTGGIKFIPVEEGLKKCLNDFLDGERKFQPLNVLAHAYYDRIAGEHTSLEEFSGSKAKLQYMTARYTPYFALRKINNLR